LSRNETPIDPAVSVHERPRFDVLKLAQENQSLRVCVLIKQETCATAATKGHLEVLKSVGNERT